MKEAFICEGIRTPIGRFGGQLSSIRTDDLAAIPLKKIKDLLTHVDWESLDEVFFGNANQAGEDNRNIARMALLLAGFPETIPGITLNRLCASGMEAIVAGSRMIKADEGNFIIAGGAGVVVLEEYEHAKARGAKIYAELTGYGATSDGYDMVAPSGEGATRCMNMALKTSKNKVDYINSHGTSTPVGDVKELEAIKNVFKDNIPKISSTKSLTGHSLGATSVQEAIYCLLMMKNKFISASAHIENMDEKAKSFPIVTKVEKNKELVCAMSNSFGFGGTNATLVFEKIS